ncbi:MAG: guanylate kinase [bacterium]
MSPEKSKRGKIFIVSSPSGCGKTTIIREIIRRLGSQYKLNVVITYTSRQPRPGEINGQDYFFVSRQEFEQKKQDNFFLETTEFNNNLYGSPAHILEELRTGQSFIFVIEQEGAQSLLKKIKNPVLIWIAPPSIQALKERILKRNSETPENIENRLKIAEREIAFAQNSHIFNYTIVNDALEMAIQEVARIITSSIQH